MKSLGANVVGGAGILTENLKDMTSFGIAEADALELGRQLVQSIRGEIIYPDQNRIHQEIRDYFSQHLKSEKAGNKRT
jgi:hypothetical protein